MKFSKEHWQVRIVLLGLKLGDVSDKELLERFDSPQALRSHARSKNLPCSFRVAEWILEQAGWARPDWFIKDPAIPTTAKRRPTYEEGQEIVLSKYFVATCGATIVREYKGKTYKAKVNTKGRLDSPNWGPNMTPTSWARKVQGRVGNMSIMPKHFWRLVYVDPTVPEDDLP